MNRPGESRPSRPAPFLASLATLVPLVLALVVPVGAAPAGDGRTPDLGDCERLRVESGDKVFAYLYGVGTQDYRWNGESWDFVAPEAVLFADPGHHAAVATHFAGPTWESRSGSRVVAQVIDRCTPDPDSIPWLLLGAVSSEGPGPFARVTFIQRLNTVGGNPPAVPGDFPGQEVKVTYTADYVFYK